MEYETAIGNYNSTGESYARKIYESTRRFYDKFLRGLNEAAESLLGNYEKGGSSAEYMKRMPPKDQRINEYFS